MAKRRGLGATIASAVIFSVILFSNLSLYLASQDRARIYLQADAEDSLTDGSLALEGAGAMNLLVKAQTSISSESLSCPTAVESVSSEIGALSDAQSAGNLSVSVTAKMAAGTSMNDNLTMLAPFNGSVAGDLDISLYTLAVGGFASDGVSLFKNETHLVHLPMQLDVAAADCVSAVQNIAQAISSVTISNCTTSAIAPLMADASRGSASDAARDGFEFSLKFDLIGNAPCTVTYQLTIGQVGIQGPGGVFTVRMAEEGSASFG